MTKVYSQQTAVSDVSFSVAKGEILGFLGPNGAGKSTTMKIATGYVSATSGSVSVAGFDVANQTLEAQRRIGYLPEHNPLYLDMYVHEFLGFSASVYHLAKSKRQARIAEVIEQCGLVPEQNKQIGQLSKGYRQRVGLAQALLHDPEILILDEPTTGLDPNQILEIRRLIKEVSRDKTVVFSTHIMQEVNALCDRVVLINKGKLVADQTVAEFSNSPSDSGYLRVEFKHDIDQSLLLDLEGIRKCEALDDGLYKIQVDNEDQVRAAILKLAGEHQLPLIGLQEEKGGSLEQVFHQLTNNPK